MSLWYFAILLFIEHFLTFWYHKIFQCGLVFPLPSLESPISTRSTGSFNWIVCRHWDLGTCAILFFYYYSFITDIKIRGVLNRYPNPSTLVFLKNIVVILGLSPFHINFSIILLPSNFCWYFVWDCTESTYKFEENWYQNNIGSLDAWIDHIFPFI